MAPVPCIGFLCAPAALLSLVVVPYLVPVFCGFVPVGVAAFLVDLLVGGARASFFSRLNFYFLMVRPGNVLMCLPSSRCCTSYAVLTVGSRAVSGGGDMARAHLLVSLKRQRHVDAKEGDVIRTVDGEEALFPIKYSRRRALVC